MVRPGAVSPKPGSFSSRNVRHVAVDGVRAGVGLDQGGDHRGVRPVGQPHLLPVEHVAVAVADGPGLDRRDVGAGLGLGHGERAAHLAGGHPRQQARLLLGGAVLGDQVRHDEVGVDDAGDRHPASGQLLHHQRVGEQRFAEPAVLLVDGEAEQPHLAHAVEDVGGVLVGVLQPLRVRDDLLVGELPNGLQDRLLHIGQAGRLGESGHLSLRGSAHYSWVTERWVSIGPPGRRGQGDQSTQPL